jgi:hypothetical protein
VYLRADTVVELLPPQLRTPSDDGSTCMIMNTMHEGLYIPSGNATLTQTYLVQLAVQLVMALWDNEGVPPSE